MKKINLTMATMAAVTLIGCGGGGSSSSSNNGVASDPYKIQTVGYTLNGSNLPSCPNASHITTLKAQNNDDFGTHSCMWICGSYEGASPITVSLDFKQDGKDSAWEFDLDVVMTAPGQCHN